MTSNRHSTHLEERVAARARPAELLLAAHRDRVSGDDRPAYRVLYSSANAGAVAAAVLAGLAVSVLPESGLRPGHARAHAGRRISRAAVAAASASCATRTSVSALADALAEHIVSSLDNLSEAQAAE